MRSRPLAALCTLAMLSPLASAAPKAKAPPDPKRVYEGMVRRVSNMVNNDRAQRVAGAFGLSLLDVTWEDTGRWEGSSVGPNISDVTIEVEGAKKHTYLMPVMRYANFTDKTADVKMDKILIPVGNAKKNGQLQLISLTDLLKDPTPYLSAADKGKIKSGSLWAKRDTHALVSAQHAFLPVPEDGQATFWPVIFNYQSTRKNPAVLTILVTRQGTSMTIIDNVRDTVASESGSWGQRLYFNHEGEKAPLIAERLKDVKENGVTANGENAQDLSDDSNVLMLIQVPLRYRAPRMSAPAKYDMYKSVTGDAGLAAPAPEPSAVASGKGAGRAAQPDIDTAVLGHGPSSGPYTELDGLTIARDARFPVRVTLQFYQATSNGVIGRDNVKAMAAQIKKVYGKGDFVGSLVVPTNLDRERPTNWAGSHAAPEFVSFTDFPGLVERAATIALQPLAKR